MIASAFEAQGFQETLKCHCLVMCQFNLSVWSEQILTKMANDAAKLTSKYN